MNKLSKNQRGFSLIEILISVLVFGVGILGLGSLQITSLKSSSNAHYRTMASVLAQDLADRMRSNLDAVRTGNYGNAVSCGTVSRLCRSSACNKDELAIFDIQEVKCGSRIGSRREGGVQGLLPTGQMRVTCVGGCNVAGATHNIQITWNGQQLDGNGNQARSLTMPVIP